MFVVPKTRKLSLWWCRLWIRYFVEQIQVQIQDKNPSSKGVTHIRTLAKQADYRVYEWSPHRSRCRSLFWSPMIIPCMSYKGSLRDSNDRSSCMCHERCLCRLYKRRPRIFSGESASEKKKITWIWVWNWKVHASSCEALWMMSMCGLFSIRWWIQSRWGLDPDEASIPMNYRWMEIQSDPILMRSNLCYRLDLR